MLLSIAQVVVPSLVLYVTLFGLLGRGTPKPGGVTIFGRVGVVGLLIGGALCYLDRWSGFWPDAPAWFLRVWVGILGTGGAITLMALFGVALMQRRS